GAPYILLNYKEDVLGDVFTLAHECGHSMHSYYSKRNNPFLCYDYTIFEAEVASTFNEQLVAKYLTDNAESDEMKTYIIAKQIDDMIATLFRQTMFAEFELLCHTQQEQGQILTASTLRKTYRDLLEAYFGPEMVLEENSDLEGLRIPHFYNAYYVYKYATGISAAIALSQRVLNGGWRELDDYLSFLKSGGSKFPIQSLKGAGVDMSTQAPVEAAMKKFEALLSQFEKTISD
ncbi:MAG: oligoendopeptidase F, partial [Spirochaetales bacterium]|nr:oligoendopeptidase F [Spirochaetales bacterium]